MNRWVPVLQDRGVQAIVVLAHAGEAYAGRVRRPDFVGEIIEEAREMSSEVDAVIAGQASRLDIRVPNVDGFGDKLIVEALCHRLRPRRPDHRQADRRGGEDRPDTRDAARRPGDGELAASSRATGGAWPGCP